MTLQFKKPGIEGTLRDPAIFKLRRWVALVIWIVSILPLSHYLTKHTHLITCLHQSTIYNKCYQDSSANSTRSARSATSDARTSSSTVASSPFFRRLMFQGGMCLFLWTKGPCGATINTNTWHKIHIGIWDGHIDFLYLHTSLYIHSTTQELARLRSRTGLKNNTWTSDPNFESSSGQIW